ncbi:MAG: S-layer protein, partial [Candidatus Aenigmarchaeota archaeon]|nr:S-layer protein [Candidatus Aenigmarchaeota archaeon]
MQLSKFGKIIAAGTLATVLCGATVGFATTLADYPSPFVSDGTVSSLIVVGAKADPADVVGAIDIAARLGGEP